MNMVSFKKTWTSVSQDNLVFKFCILGLVLSNLLLSVYMTRQEAIITLVPPQINEELGISSNSANDAFIKSWGLFIAQLMGNVKASNADFIVKSLDPLLHPSIISVMKQTLALQVDEIKKEGLSISFDPKSVSYEKSSKKVFVFGRQEISGRNGDTISNKRTYEIGIQISNYKPQIISLDAYNENPKYENPNK